MIQAITELFTRDATACDTHSRKCLLEFLTWAFDERAVMYYGGAPYVRTDAPGVWMPLSISDWRCCYENDSYAQWKEVYAS